MENKKTIKKGKLIKVWVQRQNDLVIVRLLPWHRWFWTACYSESKYLFGIDLEKDECFECEMRAFNIKKLGKLYFEKSRKNYLMGRKKGKS